MIQSTGGIPVTLNTETVEEILSDLTGSKGFDLTSAHRLSENKGSCIRGIETGGPFEIDHTSFLPLVNAPTNPNGLRNAEVLRRVINGSNILKRAPERYVIDFSLFQLESDAALFEAPFELLKEKYKDYAAKSKRKVIVRDKWRLHRRSGEALRLATNGIDRLIVTPRVGKFRVFVFVEGNVFADSAAFVVARNDDTTFGILHSQFHELWALRMGTYLGVGNDPRYTPSSTFETFTFPEGLTPNIPASGYVDDPRAQAIAIAAARLNELRENWLNPPDLVERVSEVVPGFPERILPKDESVARELKKRTLTNLYNARPAWLDHAHRALDEAVADAYGWGDDWRAGILTDDEILARLFKLNQERAAKQAK